MERHIETVERKRKEEKRREREREQKQKTFSNITKNIVSIGERLHRKKTHNTSNTLKLK